MCINLQLESYIEILTATSKPAGMGLSLFGGLDLFVVESGNIPEAFHVHQAKLVKS
jgi:hypothetical protein